MQRLLLTLICFFFLINAFANTIIVRDPVGNTLFLAHPARRIISLAPNLTEIIFAAGAGSKIVGVSQFSDFPQQARLLPRVATYNSIDIEKILSLHPDLVIAWQHGNPFAQIRRLKRLGIPVYIASFNRVSDIPKLVLAMGQLAGTEKNALKYNQHFMKRYRRLRRHYLHRKKMTVFYELYDHPLITLNKFSVVNQVIAICGGKNVYARTFGVAPRVSVESVLQFNPSVILVPNDLTASNVMKEWQLFPNLQAMKKHDIFFVNADWLERDGPRILDGISQVCHAIDIARGQQKGRKQK